MFRIRVSIRARVRLRVSLWVRVRFRVSVLCTALSLRITWREK